MSETCEKARTPSEHRPCQACICECHPAPVRSSYGLQVRVPWSGPDRDNPVQGSLRERYRQEVARRNRAA